MYLGSYNQQNVKNWYKPQIKWKCSVSSKIHENQKKTARAHRADTNKWKKPRTMSTEKMKKLR